MILSWQKNKKVERTEPGSKNPFKVTFYDGQQKWTDDYPGDGRGGRREHRKEERNQRRPSVKREKVNLDGALKKFVDGEWDAGNLNKAVDNMIVHLGREDARETIGKWLKAKGDMDGKAAEGLDVIRKRKIDVLRKKEAMSNRIDRISDKVATDFHTQEAMEDYMKSHPKSDPSNHRVVPKEYTNPGATEGQHHWVANRETTLVKNEGPMLRDVYDWVHKQSTWFEWDYDGENLNAITREHGDSVNNKPGKKDTQEAARLVRMIEKQFGKDVEVESWTTDEWVNIRVDLNLKMKKSSGSRIAHITSRIVSRAFSGSRTGTEQG